jgi:NitT/TauT family transport system permease protein
VLGLSIWQAIVWSGWKPDYALPPPTPVFRALWQGLVDGSILNGAWLTLRRAAVGYSIALVVGIVVGLAIARVKVLRIAFGSLITGIQTMPSIAWFPLAILLFQLSESAILFVVVIGAAPAIANGMIAGADNVPPLLLRAGRMLDAKGFTLWRYVILPASLPTFVSGMKQGWAFAWRSLLAGELLVIIKGTPSLGVQLQVARDFADAPALLAVMIVILVIGILADAFVFGALERAVRRRFGLTDPAA